MNDGIAQQQNNSFTVGNKEFLINRNLLFGKHNQIIRELDKS